MDDGVGVLNFNIMFEVMKIVKENDWVIMFYVESLEFLKVDMRIVENMMILRDIELVKLSGVRFYMCYVSIKESIKYIIDGKMSGVNVILEIILYYIVFIRDINDYRVNLLIREKEDVEFIIEVIKLGMVDIIGIDYVFYIEEEKRKGFLGMVGLEIVFLICYIKLVKENNIFLNRLSELMFYNLVKFLGMNKGKISIGVDGDLVIVDLDKKIKINKEEFELKGKNIFFEGMEFFGDVVVIIKGGLIKYRK